MTATQTKSQIAAADVVSLLKARNPLLWIVTGEEARVEGHLIAAAKAAKLTPRTWDVAQGVTDEAGNLAVGDDGAPLGDQDPGATLGKIMERTRQGDRGLWIMRDLPVWLAGASNAPTLRMLRNLARALPGAPLDRQQAIVVLSPSGEVPPELSTHATVIEWPMPDSAEIAEILDAAIAAMPEEMRAAAAPNGTRDAAIQAAVGLSGEEAAKTFRRSLVQSRKIDPILVAGEKKRVIAREGVLEWFDPLAGGLDAVGGLDLLKGWLIARKNAFGARARAYGLPAPKGVLLVGIPGCGKTLTAKAVATAYGMPLLRLDLGSLKSKFVGESEGNLRRAFKVIESVGRCVVWLDEIEKALQGSTSGGAADGGVSADALGAILNWMQERSGEAFVVATANDVTSLPPELMRKGRFDEVWSIDLPNASERAAILTAALRAHGRSGDGAKFPAVVQASKEFTGSEIAALVPEALFAAFADNEREITEADLLTAARSLVPLAKTAPEKIAALRNWAKGKARPATTVQAEVAQAGGLQLDIE